LYGVVVIVAIEMTQYSYEMTVASAPTQSTLSSVYVVVPISRMYTLYVVIGEPLSVGKDHSTFNPASTIDVNTLVGTSGI
jgi:hypothetical protein